MCSHVLEMHVFEEMQAPLCSYVLPLTQCIRSNHRGYPVTRVECGWGPATPA